MAGKATVDISREWIAHAVREMNPSGFPEDATLVGLEYETDRDLFIGVFESDEFPETPEGARVEKFTVEAVPKAVE